MSAEPAKDLVDEARRIMLLAFQESLLIAAEAGCGNADIAAAAIRVSEFLEVFAARANPRASLHVVRPRKNQSDDRQLYLPLKPFLQCRAPRRTKPGKKGERS